MQKRPGGFMINTGTAFIALGFLLFLPLIMGARTGGAGPIGQIVFILLGFGLIVVGYLQRIANR